MFLDTSGLLCLHHADEPGHDVALDHFEQSERLLTHGEVLSEFITLSLVRGLPRRATLEFVGELLVLADLQVDWVDRPLHQQASDLLRYRPDKQYSFCDAVSFILMRRYKYTQALTTDHHVEQEGFVRLLRP